MIENDIFIDWLYKVKWCEDNKIKLPKMYEMKFPHHNCGGFCVKAGLGHFKLLYNKMPDRYIYHENKEQKAIKEFNLKPFLSITKNKKKRYITMKEYREEYLIKMEPLEFEDEHDFGGCGCA